MPGKAFIKFANTVNPDFLVITWQRFATPLAEEGRQSYAAPHPERSLTVVTDYPEMYKFSFYQSVDGDELTTHMIDMDIDCSILDSMNFIYDYVVDRGSTGTDPDWADPATGDDTINDERLIGTDFYVQRRGFGPLRPDEVEKDNVLGSFTPVGLTFEETDTWFAIGQQTIQHAGSPAPGTTPGASGDYMSEVDIAEDTAFGTEHYRKLLSCTSAAGVTVISFASFATIPNTKVLINTHGMSGRYLTLAFSTGETVPFLGWTKNKITLGRGEEIEILFTGTAGRILRYEGDYRRLGEEVGSRKLLADTGHIEPNSIVCDGSLYNIADYPRLVNDYIKELGLHQIKTLSAWGTASNLTGAAGETISEYPNKGFFAVDDLAGTFRVPDLRKRTTRYLQLSGTDATRFTDNPGGLQMDRVASHYHKVGTEVTPLAAFQRGASHQKKNWNVGNSQNNDEASTDLNSTEQENISRNIGYVPRIII